MIEHLVDLDKKVFLALNHFAAPWMDPVMRFLSGEIPWILFFMGFIYLIWEKTWDVHRKRFIYVIVSLLIVYALTDATSVHLFKEIVMRLRPCHEPSLEGQLRLVAHRCGGSYGFVSSHAANSFGLALFSALVLKRRWFTIAVMAWAILVSYSRIYVGVHYHGDVICGGLLGMAVAYPFYLATRRLGKSEGSEEREESEENVKIDNAVN
jgi:undecaprenyl-diphosphatase